MSLPDRALFNKVAKVNIGGRLFSYPPFTIEFEQTMSMGSLESTVAKLYNPSPDTIKTAESKKQGRTRVYTQITIEAGYEDDYGTTVLGEIMAHKVKKHGADIILEMNIGDKTGIWANSIIMKSYNNQNASVIIDDMLSTVGITGEISLGSDKTYKTFIAKTFREAMKNIAKDTESIFYFKNGQLKMESSTYNRERQVLYISPSTGLIDRIEKNEKGFEFKTLFFHKLSTGDIVQIEDSRTPKATVKLTEGRKHFSTFGKSECEFKAVEI